MSTPSPKLTPEINLAIGRLKNAAINYGEYRGTDRMNAMQEEDEALTVLLESSLKDSARIQWLNDRGSRIGYDVELCGAVDTYYVWLHDTDTKPAAKAPTLREAIDAAMSDAALSGESSL